MKFSLLLVLVSSLQTVSGTWNISGDCFVLSYPTNCVLHDRPSSKGAKPCVATYTGSRPSMLDVRTARSGGLTGFFSLDGQKYNSSEIRNRQVGLQGKVLNSSTTITYVPGDNDVEYLGWEICAFPLQEGPWLTAGSCEHDPSDSECITSHNFPGNYEGSGWCFMRLKEPIKRRLELTKFDVDDYADSIKFLETEGVPWDRWTSRSVARGGDSALLEGLRLTEWTSLLWGTSTHETHEGWRMCARPEKIWNVSGGCSVDESDTHCITSPNYPNNYGSNDRCTMQLLVNDTRELEVTDFKTNSGSDQLVLINRNGTNFSFSGHDAAELHGMRIDSSASLKWSTSDQTNTDQGWRVCLRDVRTTTTTTTILTTTTTPLIFDFSSLQFGVTTTTEGPRQIVMSLGLPVCGGTFVLSSILVLAVVAHKRGYWGAKNKDPNMVQSSDEASEVCEGLP